MVYVMPAEALHLANLMCATGYIFPIDDHVLVVKNDGAYYRFQVRQQLVHCLSVMSVSAASLDAALNAGFALLINFHHLTLPRQ